MYHTLLFGWARGLDTDFFLRIPLRQLFGTGCLITGVDWMRLEWCSVNTWIYSWRMETDWGICHGFDWKRRPFGERRKSIGCDCGLGGRRAGLQIEGLLHCTAGRARDKTSCRESNANQNFSRHIFPIFPSCPTFLFRLFTCSQSVLPVWKDSSCLIFCHTNIHAVLSNETFFRTTGTKLSTCQLSNSKFP